MTGTIAQIIALTAFGNDFLKNGNLPADFESNTNFQFCKSIDFCEFRNQPQTVKPEAYIVADQPAEWFSYLKNDGCKYLRLYFQSSADQTLAKDHKLAGMIGGGGTWLIEAVYPVYSNFWASRWIVADQHAADRKIWAVNYGLTAEKKPTVNQQIDNNAVKERLNATLTEIADFAFNQDLENWGETFENARSVLDNAVPEEKYYQKDLVPVQNYSVTAKQVLFAAGLSWVFGGMGSWNDLGFATQEDNKTYDRLSAELYANINEAILAATNSF